VQTLSSGHDSGLVLAPFRGVRYDPDRVSGLANVTSPPYDVIGSGTLDELLAAEPHNIVRLILPGLERDGVPVSPARGAAEPVTAANALAASRLHDWLAAGVLATDPEPALYVYEQDGPGWLQRGLIGLVAVGTPDTAGVLPHEGVMPGPVTGRRQLMMATRANLEPIFLVYNGGAGGTDSADSPAGPAASATPGSGGHGGPAGPDSPHGPDAFAARLAATGRPDAALTASGLVRQAASHRPPLVATVTADGVTHRLWRLTDPAEHAAVAADLARRTALIADGHHRYAAYRELRDLMRGDGLGAGPWDYGLAFLVDADAYPPRLGAIHRVIPHLAPEEAARHAAEAFTVEEIPAGAPGAALSAGADAAGLPAEMAEAMCRLGDAGRQGTAFLLAGRSGFRLLTQPDNGQLRAAMPAGASARWQALDASVMQELLMDRLWSVKDNERDVLISHDAGEAVRMAIDAAGTAVICNPVPFAAVKEVAEHGERVPRKSTSFGPKPRTGLVLRTWEP
jgi:uncharacterized protein (DUF1015 family)